MFAVVVVDDDDDVVVVLLLFLSFFKLLKFIHPLSEVFGLPSIKMLFQK